VLCGFFPFIFIAREYRNKRIEAQSCWLDTSTMMINRPTFVKRDFSSSERAAAAVANRKWLGNKRKEIREFDRAIVTSQVPP
jgi:hypothetical protein